MMFVQVIVHDLATLQPLDYLQHEEPVYGLSVHPSQGQTVITACRWRTVGGQVEGSEAETE